MSLVSTQCVSTLTTFPKYLFYERTDFNAIVDLKYVHVMSCILVCYVLVVCVNYMFVYIHVYMYLYVQTLTYQAKN